MSVVFRDVSIIELTDTHTQLVMQFEVNCLYLGMSVVFRDVSIIELTGTHTACNTI